MPTWRVTCEITHAALGGRGSNTFHLRNSGVATTESEVTELMGHLEDFYTTAMGVMPGGTNVAFDGEFTNVADDEITTYPGAAWNVSSGGSTDPLPPSQCLVVGWRTGSGDRSGRGRTFVGPIGTNALQNDGTPNPGALDILRGAAAQLVTESDGFANGAFGVYSRQESVLRDFTGSFVRDIFGSLRSRRD